MTAERLLDLAEEYREAKSSRETAGGPDSLWQPIGREPAVIAQEYEAELRLLLGMG